MANRRLLATSGVIVLMAVAALFFFHSGFGSFTATHGPVTAMRAARELLRVKMSIVAIVLATIVVVAAVRGCWFMRMPTEEAPAFLPPLDSAVRI